MCSGDHYLSGDGLFQIEDAFDHVALFLRNEASFFAFVDYFLNVLDRLGPAFQSDLVSQPAKQAFLSFRL